MLAAKTPRGPCEAEESGDNESKGAELPPTVQPASTTGGKIQDNSTPPRTVAQLAHAVQHYKEIVRDQSRRILAFERQIVEQQETIESLLSQKGLIFDNFCILRQKYDGVKAHLSELLWVVMPSGYIPGVEGKDSERLEGIPPLTQYIVESPKRIGNYEIGDVLGEGQFASVRAIRKRPDIDRSCEGQDGSDRDQEGALKRPNSSHRKWSERAAKIINKADVMSLTTLRRVDNEIAVLRHLKHEGVMELHEVIHAPACLYMVTDKAGRDLFDFFDEHLEGVSEAVACLLMHKIMTPLHYCHSMGVVHRDLKPENILFADKKPLTKATPVVLCDFGLCARVDACGDGADTQVEKCRRECLSILLHRFFLAIIDSSKSTYLPGVQRLAVGQDIRTQRSVQVGDHCADFTVTNYQEFFIHCSTPGRIAKALGLCLPWCRFI